MVSDIQTTFWTHDHAKDRFFLVQTLFELLIISIILFIEFDLLLLFIYPFVKSVQYLLLKGKNVRITVQKDMVLISGSFPWPRNLILELPKVGFQLFPKGSKWKAYLGIEGSFNGKIKRHVFRLVWSDVFEIEAFFQRADLNIKTPEFWHRT